MNFPSLAFQIESASSGEIYDIEMRRTGADLTITCTCTAASNGMHCKHRVALLTGDTSQIIAGDLDKIGSIRVMLVGSDVEEPLTEVGELERKKAAIDADLKAAKKRLAKTMWF